MFVRKLDVIGYSGKLICSVSMFLPFYVVSVLIESHSFAITFPICDCRNVTFLRQGCHNNEVITKNTIKNNWPFNSSFSWNYFFKRYSLNFSIKQILSDMDSFHLTDLWSHLAWIPNVWHHQSVQSVFSTWHWRLQ